MKHYKLRIAMPVLNEGIALLPRLQALQELRQRGVELVVADGGSTDESWAIARHFADRVICVPRGRAGQMNAAAWDTPQSRADALLFLHADTQPPPCADDLIRQALKIKTWGRFDVQLNSSRLMLRMVAFMMNLRSRITGIATGDQAMFMRMTSFVQLAGFPEQALMEDIEMSKRLKQIGSPASLRQRVVTSARKWHMQGVWRTIMLMWRLRVAYFFGAKPSDLALRYGYAKAAVPAQTDLAIMAKAPIAGWAKTRLIPLLGAQRAARVQRGFIQQTVHTCQQSGLGACTLWCAPDTRHLHFRALSKIYNTYALSFEAQPDASLGERMQYIFMKHFEAHPGQPLLLMGTDGPVLSPGHLQQAAAALGHHDAVFIPVEDGGYVLIGLRRWLPEVFQNIAWSTSEVMSQTRKQLRLADASWQELLMLWDVDEPADWQRWQQLTLTKS
jgi:rSAM/selenodomain-associated transferase 2/rSAM/selenodomain-associated transferase 1